jgi:hypothetical protein
MIATMLTFMFAGLLSIGIGWLFWSVSIHDPKNCETCQEKGKGEKR